MTNYKKIADVKGAAADLSGWFRANRQALTTNGDIGGPGAAAVSFMLAAFDSDPESMEALGALSRWPRRSEMSVEDYLQAWTASCKEIHASPRLVEKVSHGLGG